MLQPVIGRMRETAALRDAVRDVASGGSAFVIDGEAGIGKSSLVADLVEYANAHGVRAITTTGVMAESAEPYAALHMLLYPLRGGIADLPAPQRRALDVAFGVATDVQPSPLLAGLAALTLLSDAAAVRPLLVIVEDLHWMDAPSEWALRMMARRVGEDRVVMVMTTRNTDMVETPGIRRLHLGPLDESDADELLAGISEAPTGQARRDLLRRAEGNPLALHELGRAATAADHVRERPVVGRVEQEFAARYAELDQSVRLPVLAVALSGTTSAEEAARVAARAIGKFPTPTWTEQASASSLLEWAPPRAIRFRHPLVQSAVLSVASPSERTAVLRSLVLEHQDDPLRTIWWRAELASGHEDALADEITALGEGRNAMSDALVASRAYERAAELTSDVARRVERRIVAAELAGLSGRTSEASLLVQRARDEAPDELRAARAAWVAETLPTGRTGLALGDLGPALHAISGMQAAGGVEHATDALLHLAAIAWDHTSDADPGDPMLAVVEALALPEDDPRSLLLAARTEPVVRGDRVLELALAAAPTAQDEESAWLLGYALNLVGEIDTAHVLLDRALSSMRTRGELRTFPQALMGTSMTTYLTGDVATARVLAEQAESLGRDLGDEGFSAAARCALAWFDALEGTYPDAERISGGTAAGAQVLRSSAMRATLFGATGLAHLMSGRAADALEPLRRLFDPEDDSYNPSFAVLTSHDYVDAALETDNRQDAERRLRELEQLHARWHAPMVRAAVDYARTALLPDVDLETASSTLLTERWPIPYLQARALLRLGRRLRRLHRSTAARAVLHAALELFEAMPAPSWEERTRDAIRATGERLPGTGQRSIELLTPQELRVCTLAARGLSNRAIGEHLFVSPRTVGAHLYAAFQKLGVSSRQQLPSVLPPEPTTAPEDQPATD
jgi:DNA-binding CsgD family transcriptional regulator